MIVRCGRCQAELEIAAPGEFMCPACGSRNVVRGPAQPAPAPFSSGGIFPSSPQPGPQDPAPGVRWVVCPSCTYRFAVGEVAQVTCPSCSRKLALSEHGVNLAE